MTERSKVKRAEAAELARRVLEHIPPPDLTWPAQVIDGWLRCCSAVRELSAPIISAPAAPAPVEQPMQPYGVVRICPIYDRDCGDFKAGWCNECPKRPKASNENWRYCKQS